MSLRPLAAAFALLILPASLSAGPLTPPVGPITSTGKTLTETEPRTLINAANTPGDANSVFRITQPGSYYLGGNVNVPSGFHAIEVAVPGVSIDLNGFSITGVPGSLDGINFLLDYLEVHNGRITAMGGVGLRLGTKSRLTAVTVGNCAGDGISAGNECVITHCVSAASGGIGIQAGFGCVITHCEVSSNSSHGVNTSTSCSILDCVATSNSGAGFRTIGTSTIARCNSTFNIAGGIQAGAGTHIYSNTCSSNNSGAGINVTGGDCRVEGNNCTSNNIGIDIDVGGNVIIRNTCSGNPTNWSIAANNVFGPILDRTAPASAAVSGNSAPSSLGTTDANANFTY